MLLFVKRGSNLNQLDLTKIDSSKIASTGIETGSWNETGNGRIKITGFIALIVGEPRELELILTKVNWWLVGLTVGFVLAIVHLILITNPSICYLYAKDQVRGFEVTLPEAMASVKAWGWFNLFLTPVILVSVLAAAAWLIKRIGRLMGNPGGFRICLGMITVATMIVCLGRLTGYLMINAWNLKSLNDLRDLTPGVGLGLLPFFTEERVGPFWREVVRGFDLFGIWTVLVGVMIFRVYHHFRKMKSFLLAGIYYSVFIGLRWAMEGPVYQFWHYFWHAGNF
jgi:hypothetical protein